MAEARSAVSYRLLEPKFSVVVSNEEIVLRMSTKAFPTFLSGIRTSFQGRLYRLRNMIYNAFYPVPPYEWTLYFAAPAAIMLLNYPQLSPLSNMLWRLEGRLPQLPWVAPSARIGAVSIGIGSATILVTSYIRRILLSLLLRYQGWLYDNPKQTNWVTTLWGIAVKFVSGSITTLTHHQPLLYSNQASLPHLPVPPLDQTCKKFLASVQPILPAQEYAEMKKLVEDFQKKEGPVLQRYLSLKSWFAPNYVTDWWETYVYLRGRSPIIINSNYYILDSKMPPPTTRQVARAAFLVVEFTKFKEMVDTEKLPAMFIRGTVPMCMYQYRRIFSTTRIPGKEIDTLRQYDFADSKHIAVLRKGRWYVMDLYMPNGTRLTPPEVESQLKWIINDADRAPLSENDPSACIAALTAEDRSVWAQVREECFSFGDNKTSLNAIESAMFVLSLDHEDHEEDGYSGRARALFHGTGTNRWCDKSFNLIVFPNARVGLHVEHSWADAPVIAHMMEASMLVGEVVANVKHYDDDGWVIRDPAHPPRARPAPVRLRWALTDVAREAINRAVVNVKKMIDDIDLQVYHYPTYGKGFVKSCKISPDAYVQIALQVAYFDETKQFALTYESSMTRLFKHGRTETVRPVSNDSVAFVHALNDPNVDQLTLSKLLQKAGETHQNGYRDAMTGKGIDRHIFAMYVVSKGMGVDSAFLNKALSMKWRVSTSQQPQNQTGLWDPIRDADKISPGGGFGPVDDLGYGISYMIANDKEFFFHVSSKNSSKPTVDSARFAKKVGEALDRMKAALEVKKDKKTLNIS